MAHKHRASFCPHCRQIMSASTNADGSTTRPVPGDLTVCLYCLGVMQFVQGDKLVGLSPAEIEAMPADDRQIIQDAQQLAKARREKEGLQ